MRLRIALFAVLGVVVLLLVSAGIALATLDFGRFKTAIATQVEQSTGRRVALDGKVELTLWPRAALSVRDVTLANAPWGSRPDMLHLGSLSAQVELWPLLVQRRLRITRVVASDADLLLETGEDGRGNWDLNSASAPDTAGDAPPAAIATTQSGLPEIGEVRLSNIAVTWRDARGGAETRLVLKQAALTPAPAGRLALRLDATYRDQPIGVVATIDQPAGFLAPGGPFAANADVTLPSAVARLSGRLADARAGTGLELAVTVEAEPVDALGRLLDLPLPAARFLLSAQVNGDLGETLRATDLKLQLGGSDLTGTAELALAGARPKLTAVLEATRLDIAELLAAHRAAEPATPAPALPPPTPDGRLFSAEPVDLTALRHIDADLTLRIGQLATPGLPIDQASLRLVLDDRDLALPPFAFTIEGAHVAGDARINARGAVAALALDIAAQRIDLGRLLAHFTGRQALVAKGDLVLAVRGAGASPRAVMAALDGNASLVVGQGTLPPGFLDAPAVTALRAVVPQFAKLTDSRLNCAIARFDIARGLATARLLAADAGDFTLLGTGTVSLANETLALDLVPRVKIAGVAGIAVPVQLRGTFLEPALGSVTGRALAGRNNPLAAIGALVLDPGASRANPCGGLAELPAHRPPIPAPLQLPNNLGGALRSLIR